MRPPAAGFSIRSDSSSSADSIELTRTDRMLNRSTDRENAREVLVTGQRREVEACYCAFLAWSENAAPCGSMAFTIQSPPGTSIGPLRICPPFALMRSVAAVMSGTRK